jgi:GT2 family glycosyltransferase
MAISEAPYFTKNMSLSERTIAYRLPIPYGYTRYISPGSMLIRRSVFNEVGFFDETLGYPYAPGEDQEFAARVLRKRYKIFIDTRFINLHLKPKSKSEDGNARKSVKNHLHFLKSTLKDMPPVHYKVFRAGPICMKLEVLFVLYPITFLLPLLSVYLLPLPILPFLYYLYKCKTSFVSRCKISLVLVTYRFVRSTGVLLFLTKKLFASLRVAVGC